MQHDAADKKHNKIQASYTLEGTVLENVDSIKYLGVTITSDLKWNSHIRIVCSKANRTLGFLRRNLFSCPQDVKEAAYKSMVRPILEYGSTVWDPHCNGLNDELENVQKRAARFVTRNNSYETFGISPVNYYDSEELLKYWLKLLLISSCIPNLIILISMLMYPRDFNLLTFVQIHWRVVLSCFLWFFNCIYCIDF